MVAEKPRVPTICCSGRIACAVDWKKKAWFRVRAACFAWMKMTENKMPFNIAVHGQVMEENHTQGHCLFSQCRHYYYKLCLIWNKLQPAEYWCEGIDGVLCKPKHAVDWCSQAASNVAPYNLTHLTVSPTLILNKDMHTWMSLYLHCYLSGMI